MMNHKKIYPITSAKKMVYAPTSVFETNFAFFQPVNKYIREYDRLEERPVYDDGEFIKITMIGEMLTQIHRNIMDIILYHGRTVIMDDNYEPVKVITLDEILRVLGHRGVENKKWLLKKIRQMTLTRVVLNFYDDPEKKEEFSFIDKLIHIGTKDGNVEYRITFHENYHKFLESTFTYGYPSFLDDILKLKNAATQAVVRYCLSFSKSTQISLRNALSILGVDENDERSIHRYAKLVYEELKAEGHKFGIELIKDSEKREKDYLSYVINYRRSRMEIEGKKISIHPYSPDGERIINKKRNILDEAQKTA